MNNLKPVEIDGKTGEVHELPPPTRETLPGQAGHPQRRKAGNGESLPGVTLWNLGANGRHQVCLDAGKDRQGH